MQVVHLCEATAGGVARHLAFLLPELEARGVRNTLIYSAYRADAVTTELICVLKDCGIKAKTVNMKRGATIYDLVNILEVTKYLEACKKGCDIVIHAHSAKAGAVGRLAAKLVRAPVIYNPHAFPTYASQGDAARRWLYFLAEKFLAKCTDALIAGCRLEVEEAMRIGYREEDIFVIPNRLSRKFIEKVARDVDGRGLRGNVTGIEARIGFLGRLASQKRPEIFVEAFSILASRHSVIAEVWGDGPLMENIRAKVRDLGLERNVFLRGWGEVREALSTMDILVISSDYESGPFVALEAAACGIPVVMTRVGESEFIEENGAGIVVSPGDPRAIADALSLLIRHPEMRREMGRRGREAVMREDAGWMAEKTIAVYREVLARTRGRKRSSVRGVA